MSDYGCGYYWLGHPGSLIPVRDVGVHEVTDDLDVRVSTSLGGGRRVREARHRAPRSWRIDLSARPEETAQLRALLAATLGPYVLVEPMAQVTNVLTPEQSVLKGTSPALGLGGGWPIVGGGVSAMTRTNPAAAGGAMAVVTLGTAHAPPSWTGRTVTGSAYLATARAEGAYVVLDWLDAAGAQVGATVQGSHVSGMDGLRRSVVSAATPAGAVACRLRVAFAEVLSMPAVTWTDEALPWDVGNGAARVSVSGLSRRALHAVPGPRGPRLQDVSITLVESGPPA